MEEVFRPQGVEKEGVFRATVGVRPTLLSTGVEKGEGVGGIRVGRESEPEMGYVVSRKDVGLWIYNHVVEGKGKGWEGDVASLTS